MGTRRFNFSDEYENGKPPASVWLTRSLIVGVVVAIVSVVKVLYPHAFNLF
jgi:hypothetical protein